MPPNVVNYESGFRIAQSYRVNWSLVKRLYRTHVVLFSRAGNLVLLLCLMVICAAEQVFVYFTGLIAGDFYEVLLNKDIKGFETQVLKSFLFILGIALVVTLRMYVVNVLVIFFRSTLTHRLHESYFRENEYYRLNILIPQHILDNPDQRMTADIQTFSQYYASTIPRLITSPFVIGYYSWDAYSRAGPVGPSGVYVFFLVGALLNICLMSPISKKVFQLERREGDFRIKHVFVRNHAEEIASSCASRLEYNSTNSKLKRLLTAQRSLVDQEAFLDLSTNLFNYLGAILSYLIIAIPIFSGVYDYMDKAQLGKEISQTSFVCMTLIYDFTQLIDLAYTFGSMSGVTHRIMELLELMESKSQDDTYLDCLNYNLHSPPPPRKKEEGDVTEREASLLVLLLNNVTLGPPLSDQVLLENLDLKLTKGSKLLITGPSSAGKSSVLRLIRGIWKARIGRTMLQSRNILYLPQKPIFTEGSLLENMVYPSEREPELDDAWFIEQLLALKLHHLLERYSLRADKRQWSDILSPGEMQRLCFIRVFYHNPDFILLDEATSSLPTNTEVVIYERIMRVFKGATIISVGHRETLRAFHDLELSLTTGKDWALHQINHSSDSQSPDT